MTEKTRHTLGLKLIDFAREIGILYCVDEEEDEDQHLYVSARHNFMCELCHNFLDKERGFVLIPLSRLPEIYEKFQRVRK